MSTQTIYNKNLLELFKKYIQENLTDKKDLTFEYINVEEKIKEGTKILKNYLSS